MDLSKIRKFVTPLYGVHSDMCYFPQWLEENNVILNPDFQRGHVWNDIQQTKYIEHILMDGKSGRDLYFNHPGWMGNWKGDMVCVDGLQRITAALKFSQNKLAVFGGYFLEDLKLSEVKYESLEDIKRCILHKIRFTINVHDLKTEAEVIQWYLDFNSGGTPHTQEELDRVRKLLDEKSNS
jgi:uncharacterized protein YfkK (UPF0435 family)